MALGFIVVPFIRDNISPILSWLGISIKTKVERTYTGDSAAQISQPASVVS